MSWKANYTWERTSGPLRISIDGPDRNEVRLWNTTPISSRVLTRSDMFEVEIDDPKVLRRLAHDLMEASYALEDGPPEEN